MHSTILIQNNLRDNLAHAKGIEHGSDSSTAVMKSDWLYIHVENFSCPTEVQDYSDLSFNKSNNIMKIKK